MREGDWRVQNGHFGDFANFHVDFPMDREGETVILEESHIEEPANDNKSNHGNNSKENGERVHGKK